MDTSTGAILAMATTTPFNPNSPYELDAISLDKLERSGFKEGSAEYISYKKELLETMWSNKAVSETYEPGSTFKIVTVASSLDAGVVTENDTFSCHGYLAVGGYNIRCHKKGGHGSGFDLAYGLQMSCNPTMMTIAERLGANAFYEYVKAFGYFEKTGIDLPSEATTIFHDVENIGTTELATASFGQRFKVSIIRQLTSVAAIANGGELVTPHLVEKIVDKDGNCIEDKKYESRGRAVSESVANAVADILEKGVSGDGGAKNARVDGYKIAAKTGTSEKFDVLDENGNSYLRIGSTVAFSLSDDGGIAVIIVVDEPTSTVKYGSVVAAPYVSSFLESALPYLGYESAAEEKYTCVGSLIGLPTADAVKKLKEAGVEYLVIGKGEIVAAQTPNPNDPFINSAGKVILYTENGDEKYASVPNVIGLNIDMANKVIIQSGLNIRIKGISGDGKATVVSQSIPPGSVVPLGSVIELGILYIDFED
jgi:stage V sporulation protein D (sporulation-specific penicillin-binding protein)